METCASKVPHPFFSVSDIFGFSSIVPQAFLSEHFLVRLLNCASAPQLLQSPQMLQLVQLQSSVHVTPIFASLACAETSIFGTTGSFGILRSATVATSNALSIVPVPIEIIAPGEGALCRPVSNVTLP